LTLQTGTAVEGQAGGRASAVGTGLLNAKPIAIASQQIHIGGDFRFFRANIAFGFLLNEICEELRARSVLTRFHARNAQPHDTLSLTWTFSSPQIVDSPVTRLYVVAFSSWHGTTYARGLAFIESRVAAVKKAADAAKSA
jgi:hypothetical protein